MNKDLAKMFVTGKYKKGSTCQPVEHLLNSGSCIQRSIPSNHLKYWYRRAFHFLSSHLTEAHGYFHLCQGPLQQ